MSLGQKYKEIKESNRVKNKKDPWAFVAISRNFSDDESWEYLMGDVVSSFDGSAQELTKCEIPAQTYAVFKIRPRFSFLWGITIGLTKKFVYTEWLPKSNYSRSSIPIGDFEYHDARSISPKPEIDLYVAVKEKRHPAP